MSPALYQCRDRDKATVRNLVGSVFNLNVDDMALATLALQTFTSHQREFSVTTTALRRIHSLISATLDKIISSHYSQANVMQELAQAYIVTEYQYRRGVLDKPCLAGLIEEVLNTLSQKLRSGDARVRDYARRVRLLLDSALVATRGR